MPIRFERADTRFCAGTRPENVTKQDLAIPDTYCSWTESRGNLTTSSPVTSGHACPANMDCVPLKLEWHGFAGFDNFSAPSRVLLVDFCGWP